MGTFAIDGVTLTKFVCTQQRRFKQRFKQDVRMLRGSGSV